MLTIANFHSGTAWRSRANDKLRPIARALVPFPTPSHHSHLHKILRRQSRYDSVLFLRHARVPIIKYTHASGAKCDIGVGTDGVFKSRCLGLLADIDGRYRDLVRLVKRWAQANAINEPANGTLNSFAWSLLVAFHLQKVRPPVLPPLAELLSESPAEAIQEALSTAAGHSSKPGTVGPLRALSDRLRDIRVVEQRVQGFVERRFGSDNKVSFPPRPAQRRRIALSHLRSASCPRHNSSGAALAIACVIQECTNVVDLCPPIGLSRSSFRLLLRWAGGGGAALGAESRV